MLVSFAVPDKPIKLSSKEIDLTQHERKRGKFLLLTVPEDKNSLFPSLPKSPEAQVRAEDRREHFKWAEQGVPTEQLEQEADGMWPVCPTN